ncbi:hypothetical protein G4B88_030110, partial [Cannabis sativa]
VAQLQRMALWFDQQSDQVLNMGPGGPGGGPGGPGGGPGWGGPGGPGGPASIACAVAGCCRTALVDLVALYGNSPHRNQIKKTITRLFEIPLGQNMSRVITSSTHPNNRNLELST